MSEKLLVWLDLETTGLVPEEPVNDQILEVGIVLTNLQLKHISNFQALLEIPESTLMSEYVTKMHAHSGLLQDCRTFGVGLEQVTTELIRFLDRHELKENIILHGSTVHFDARFIRRWMPAFAARLHHRIVDVSSLKEVVRTYCPGHLPPPIVSNHRALFDCRDSIDEFKHYGKTFNLLPRE